MTDLVDGCDDAYQERVLHDLRIQQVRMLSETWNVTISTSQVRSGTVLKG